MSGITRSPRRLTALALAALFAALATLVAVTGDTASAAGNNGYRTAKFRVEIKGWQKMVQQHTHLAEDECDVENFSSGSETLRFHTVKPIVVTAYYFRGLDNPDFFAGRRLGLPTKAVFKRSYTPRVSGPTGDDCGDNGGGVEPTPPDCGRRVREPWKLDLAFLDDRKGRLGLSYYGSSTDPFNNCSGAGFPASFPYLATEKGLNGNKGPIAAQLSQRDLFNPEFRKWISIARGTYHQRTEDWWAKTTVRWEVSFTRLGGR